MRGTLVIALLAAFGVAAVMLVSGIEFEGDEVLRPQGTVKATPTAPGAKPGPGAPAQPEPATELAAKTPAPDAPAAITAPSPQPTFDIVRVNPAGNAVIAGRAEPGATVIVRDGREAIGSATADNRGEWVVVPEAPIPGGARQLSLTAQAPDKPAIESEEIVVLIVPEDEDTGAAAGPAVAVLTTREGDGPSTLLQRPQAVQGAQSAQSTQTPGSVPEGTAVASGVIPGAPLPKARPATGVAAAADTGPQPAKSEVVAQVAPAPPEAAATETARVATAGAEAPATDTAIAQELAKLTPASGGASAAPEDGPNPFAGEPEKPAELSLDVIDYDDGGNLVLSGRAQPETTVRAFVEEQPLGEATTTEAGDWRLTPSSPVAPGRHALRLEQVGPSGTVVASLNLPFRRAALPGGALAPGQVVVQPGNSLWRIARATYGSGIKYTVIYAENAIQIRNPNLIYPGQIFTLPESN